MHRVVPFFHSLFSNTLAGAAETIRRLALSWVGVSVLLSFRAPAHVQLRRHTLRGGGVALHVGGGAAFGGLHQNSYLGQRETSNCFARPGKGVVLGGRAVLRRL